MDEATMGPNLGLANGMQPVERIYADQKEGATHRWVRRRGGGGWGGWRGRGEGGEHELFEANLLNEVEVVY